MAVGWAIDGGLRLPSGREELGQAASSCRLDAESASRLAGASLGRRSASAVIRGGVLLSEPCSAAAALGLPWPWMVTVTATGLGRRPRSASVLPRSSRVSFTSRLRVLRSSRVALRSPPSAASGRESGWSGVAAPRPVPNKRRSPGCRRDGARDDRDGTSGPGAMYRTPKVGSRTWICGLDVVDRPASGTAAGQRHQPRWPGPAVGDR